jgi:hypothetical protein
VKKLPSTPSPAGVVEGAQSLGENRVPQKGTGWGGGGVRNQREAHPFWASVERTGSADQRPLPGLLT